MLVRTTTRDLWANPIGTIATVESARVDAVKNGANPTNLLLDVRPAGLADFKQHASMWSDGKRTCSTAAALLFPDQHADLADELGLSYIALPSGVSDQIQGIDRVAEWLI